MANWKYVGINKSGKIEKGVVQAKTQKEVRKVLRVKGIRPKKIMAPSILEFDISEWIVENGLSQPFTKKDLINFTKQLTTMINAGVPILDSLETLHRATKQPVLKKTILRISTEVGEGKSISEALAKQQGFDRLYCNLVRAGEAGGILDTILVKLSDHMEKQEKIKAQIKSAMTYPAIVVLVGIGVIWSMMVFVVPQFVSMLTDSGQEIPWITQMVIDASDFLSNHGLVLMAGIIVFIFFLLSYIKTPTGKAGFDAFIIKMPLFGGLVVKGNLTQFSRTLSTMLSSGVSLIDSLDICIETIDNKVIADDIRVVRKKVVQGKSLTDPLKRIHYFPEMVSSMIRVGEQTGQISEMLEKVSEVFENEVNDLVGNMTKLIEPIIIVVLGGIVATILVAMYLPMFMSAGGA